MMNGKFYDYFNFSAFYVFLHFFNLPRENVEPLIHHVSGAHYKGFSTHDQAKEFYLGAKRLDKVRIVRDPSDDKNMAPWKTQYSRLVKCDVVQ